jgi:hypothetical protein
MPIMTVCSFCGGTKTVCGECNRTVHVVELTPGGCTFCSPILCPHCHTRALAVSGCRCGRSHYVAAQEPVCKGFPAADIDRVLREIKVANASRSIQPEETAAVVDLPDIEFEPLGAPIAPSGGWHGIASGLR